MSSAQAQATADDGKQDGVLPEQMELLVALCSRVYTKVEVAKSGFKAKQSPNVQIFVAENSHDECASRDRRSVGNGHS